MKLQIGNYYILANKKIMFLCGAQVDADLGFLNIGCVDDEEILYFNNGIVASRDLLGFGYSVDTGVITRDLYNGFKKKQDKTERVLRRCRKWIRGYSVCGDEAHKRKNEILQQIEELLK